jgi:serine/threonine-protein kinase
MELLVRDSAGVLWRGRARATGEPVAVRLSDIGSEIERRAVERTQAQWEALAAIRHPALIQMRDLVVEANHVGLVTEFAEATTLDDYLKAFGPWTPAYAARMAADLAEAIAAVHAAGAMHTNVTGQNSLVGADGRIRLADLATARLVRRPARGATPGGGPAPGGAFCGAPAYAAPELIQAQLWTPAADVYALGIVLYEMLTGTTPYEGGPIGDVLKRHVEAEPVWPGGLPSGLRYVLVGCLRHDPAERPTAVAVAADLRALAPQILDVPAVTPLGPAAARYRIVDAPAAPVTGTEHGVAHASEEPAEWTPRAASPAGHEPASVPDHGAAHSHADYSHAAREAGRPARTVTRTVVAALGVTVLVGGLALAAAIAHRDSGSGPSAGRAAGPSPAPGSGARPLRSASAAPSLSARAARRTLDGAAEFTSYWFDTLAYAIRTGDVTGLAAESDPRCTQCEATIDLIRRGYAGGGSLEGGSYVVHSVIVTTFPDTGQPPVDVVFDRSPVFRLDSGGHVLETTPGASFVVCRALIEWSGTRWRMLTLTATAPLA